MKHSVPPIKGICSAEGVRKQNKWNSWTSQMKIVLQNLQKGKKRFTHLSIDAGRNFRLSCLVYISTKSFYLQLQMFVSFLHMVTVSVLPLTEWKHGLLLSFSCLTPLSHIPPRSPLYLGPKQEHPQKSLTPNYQKQAKGEKETKKEEVSECMLEEAF